MFQNFIKSRKWMVGTFYVVGVIACDLLKLPLSEGVVMWTSLIVLCLVGGQHMQEAIAARVSGRVEH